MSEGKGEEGNWEAEEEVKRYERKRNGKRKTRKMRVGKINERGDT